MKIVWVKNPSVDPVFGVPLHVQFKDIPFPVDKSSPCGFRLEENKALFTTLEAAEAHVASQSAESLRVVPEMGVEVAKTHTSLVKARPAINIPERLWRSRHSFSCMADSGSRCVNNFNPHITDKLGDLIEYYAAKIEKNDVVSQV